MGNTTSRDEENQNTLVDYILSVLCIFLLIVIILICSVLGVTLVDYNIKEESISATECTIIFSSDCTESKVSNLDLYHGKDILSLLPLGKSKYSYLKVNDTLYKVNIQQDVPEGSLSGYLLKSGNVTRVYFGEITNSVVMWRKGYIAICN